MWVSACSCPHSCPLASPLLYHILWTSIVLCKSGRDFYCGYWHYLSAFSFRVQFLFTILFSCYSSFLLLEIVTLLSQATIYGATRKTRNAFKIKKSNLMKRNRCKQADGLFPITMTVCWFEMFSQFFVLVAILFQQLRYRSLIVPFICQIN